jgi:hypothetical protein
MPDVPYSFSRSLRDVASKLKTAASTGTTSRYDLHESPDQTELYIHISLLNHLGDSIRILELHPGKGSDRVECTIKQARLTNKPAYEALSYTLGSSLSMINPLART